MVIYFCEVRSNLFGQKIKTFPLLGIEPKMPPMNIALEVMH